MKPSIKIFTAYILLLILIIIIASCNSVKRVLKDPEKFEEVAREVVKRGYCINDTVIVTKDSIKYITRDSIIRDSIDTPCPDFTKKFSSGAVVTSKDGVLSVTFPVQVKDKIITKTITNNIRDKKLEEILRGERDAALDRAAALKVERDKLQDELKSQKRKNTYTWIGLGIILLLGIGLKTGILKKFIPFL